MESPPTDRPRSRFAVEIDDLTVERLRRRDARAQEIVYRAFSAPVFDLAYRFTACRATADDVMQDVFITVFDKIRSFRGEGRLGAWIRQIAVRESLQALRRRRRWAPLEGRDELSTQTTGTLELEQALMHLPDRSRAVLWLYHVEGYTHKEIAAATGQTASFSKSQVARAHARLREIYGVDNASSRSRDASSAPPPDPTAGHPATQPCIQ